MSALVVYKEKVATIRHLLEKQGPELAKALSGAVTPDKMIRTLMTDIQTNPKLLDCSPNSLIRCVMEAAQLNLVTGSAMGQAYLVPYKKECRLIIGYKGLLALVHRSGVVASVQAKVVRVGDHFAYRAGTINIIEHQMAEYTELPLPAMTHVYAIAELRNGGRQCEVMQRIEVEAIRARSQSGDRGPWVTDYDAMALKTCLRRLARSLPQSTELQYALSETDRMEAVPPVLADGQQDVLGMTEDDNGGSGQANAQDAAAEPVTTG